MKPNHQDLPEDDYVPTGREMLLLYALLFGLTIVALALHWS